MAENKLQDGGRTRVEATTSGAFAQIPMQAKPKVTFLRTQDGGVWLGVHGTMTDLRGEKGTNPNGLPSSVVFDMELDRSLGGVVIRYDAQGKTATVLVPMAHVRQVTLAE